MRNGDAIVVGAGYAGLAAALSLRDRGFSVTVLEARARVGGRVWSRRLANGEIVELGGEWIFEGYDELCALAKRFGLALAPMGFDFARRDVVDLAAPLDLQDELLADMLARISKLSRVALDAATLGRFLEDWTPTPELAALRARFQGTCAVDLREVALRPAVEEGLLRPGGAGASWRLALGNQALADAIAASLPDVRLGSVVTGIEQAEDRIGLTGDGFESSADVVVVAVPLPVLRSLPVEPALPRPYHDALEALRFGVASKVAVATERPLEPRARQSVAGPFWWWSSIGPSGGPRSAVTGYAGSPAAQEELGLGQDDASAWLERLVRLDPEVVPIGEPLLARWEADPFARGAYTAIPPGVADLMPVLAEPIGRVILAGEHTAGVALHGTLEGALRSGARAADMAARVLSRG